MSGGTQGDARIDVAVDAAQADAAVQACPELPTRSAFRAPASQGPLDDVLRINHLQVKGSHNSYHVRPTDLTLDIPDWNYSHMPLGVQLQSQGVRAIELDIHWNARCQHFEVYHLAPLDVGTTCAWLTECLATVRDFSQAHRGHAPIFIQIETKDTDTSFDEARVQALENEVLAVFPREWLITPDEIRGDASSVAEGLRQHGWPRLRQARGRVLFFMQQGSSAAGLRNVYTHNLHDLDGRLMFMDSDVEAPYAAVRVLNDPMADAEAIAAALSAQQLVRTRADADPRVAQSNDRTRLQAALTSGAHIISTDFPAQTPGSDYVVEIPGGMPARCTPASTPANCSSLAIEDPSRLIQ